MKSYFNRLLRINLSDQSFFYEDLHDDTFAKTLGGKGLGVHLLLKENPTGVDPLSSENRFIITTGPVTGTTFWGQSRFGVYSKSPATNGYGESYCGGTLAPKIKGCGIDAVILEGRSKSLSFLLINEKGVSFKDASNLKGKDTAITEEHILKNSPPGTSAMTIGPAGENLVRFACIKSDRWRSLGRCGMGAVLGSKNLKGIAFSGLRKAEIANEKLLKDVIKSIAKEAKDYPLTSFYQKLGTPMQVATTNIQNCFPTRYWQSGHFSKWENISADYMINNFDVKSHSCPNCFLKCTKYSRIKKGRHQGLELEGPEYETIYALGGLNEVDSLEEIAYLNDLCDKLGLDTMSAGNISAFAIEAFKRGKIHFEIDYNQPDRMAVLFHLIAENRGVGALFAKGIKFAAEELGLEDIAIHVKGLEPAGFEPRVLKGMALSYATAARGACHLRGTFYKAELTGQVDRDMSEGKAAFLIDYEDRAALFDCLILCRFYRDLVPWVEIGRIIAATTGLALSKKELENLANSITERTREFNTKEGITGAADTLPIRFFKEKTSEGASLSTNEFDIMLKEYNNIRKSR